MKRTISTLVLSLTAACGDDGSLGDITETGGGGTAASADSGTGATSTSAGTMGSTESSTTDAGATESGSTGESATLDDSTGGAGACDRPGNCTLYPAPCRPDRCGTLDSPWDENGCLRETCGVGDDCADGERCHHPQWFGGCASSGLSCEDDPRTRSCACSSLPDCSGGYCVPAELWPTPDAGPASGQIDDACAPDDGPATELMFGGLGSCPMDEPTIRLVFYSGGPALGTYAFESQSDGFGELSMGGDPPVVVVAAWVEITAFGGGTASGSYEVIGDGALHLAAEFVDVPYCASGFACG